MNRLIIWQKITTDTMISRVKTPVAVLFFGYVLFNVNLFIRSCIYIFQMNKNIHYIETIIDYPIDNWGGGIPKIYGFYTPHKQTFKHINHTIDFNDLGACYEHNFTFCKERSLRI